MSPALKRIGCGPQQIGSDDSDVILSNEQRRVRSLDGLHAFRPTTIRNVCDSVLIATVTYLDEREALQQNNFPKRCTCHVIVHMCIIIDFNPTSFPIRQ